RSRKGVRPSGVWSEEGGGGEPMIEVGSMTPADALYMGISFWAVAVARMERSAIREFRSPHSASLHAGYVSYTSAAAAETNEFDGPLPTREHTRRRNVDYIFLY